MSDATNLIENDTNKVADVFVHNRSTGKTRCISVGNKNEQGNAASYDGAINGDGTRMVFASMASNLVPGDTNGRSDIFLRTEYCKDIDKGNNPGTLSRVILGFNDKFVNYFDQCCGKFLKEYYCDDDNELQYQWYQCTACIQGKCSKARSIDKRGLPNSCQSAELATE